MSNLSDKEIDRLSREASDLYEPDSSSLSWSRLEQKLIEQMPERPPDGFRFGRMNPYIWGPAAVLLAGISFYFIKNSNYSQLSTRTSEQLIQSRTASKTDSERSAANIHYVDSLSSAEKSTASAAKNANKPEQLAVEPKQTEKTKNSQPESGRLSNDAETKGVGTSDPDYTETATGKPSTNNGKGSKSILSSAALSSGLSASAGSNTSSAGSLTKSRGNQGSSVVPVSGTILAGAATSNAINTQASDSRTSIETKEASTHPLPVIASAGTGLGTVKGNDSLLIKLAQANAPTPQKSMHINRSLSIGFTFGADYTDAGGIVNNQLSNNIGITLGYYLTSNLSVNTGLIYSNKFYWSPGHGPDRPPYNQGPGLNPSTFAYSPDIEYVNGACNMYELPLTLGMTLQKMIRQNSS